MKFGELLEIVDDEPVFETGLLLAGDVNATDVRRQLSRWAAAGRVYQVRRGLYALAPPFARSKPHPFIVANHMMRGSYVSLQSALAHYGLIPEAVPVVTCVTTTRPSVWETPLGSFDFRRIKVDLFFGYQWIEVAPAQNAFVALPEKALLDLIYLQPGGDDRTYLEGLRLQNLERLDLARLQQLAADTTIPKLVRGGAAVVELAQAEGEEYVSI
jgi:predicted transcriptional regulator of viral defense system